MTKLLNLTIKIDHPNKYRNETDKVLKKLNYRVIELSSLEIKDQVGGNVSELKTHSSSGVVSPTKFLVGDIEQIKISSVLSLDIPISWAWENSTLGFDTTIEFTLKGINYDEEKGWKREGNAIFLSQKDLETEVYESQKGKFFNSWQIIELDAKNQNRFFHEFRDLWWKIIKSSEDNQIDRFLPEVDNWEVNEDKNYFYELRNINNNEQEVKKICDDFFEDVQNLDKWKNVGIKTLAEIWAAKNNGFDIIAEPPLKTQIRNGKYKGFSITTGEKHKVLILMNMSLMSHTPSSVFFPLEKERYTKENIDNFRKIFPDENQVHPKYFRGFRPGDIKDFGGQLQSAYHQQDIEEKKGKFYPIKVNEEFSRTFYELRSIHKSKRISGDETKEKIRAIISDPEAFEEWNDKTKKEQWDFYWKWINNLWAPDFVRKNFAKLHQKLTNLLPLLDKSSFANESKENCETALNILKDYRNPTADSDEEVIKNKFSSEINAKRPEITNRINFLHSNLIEAAMNEDYGGSQLSDERKKIFTVHKDQIKNAVILTQVKELIKLLVKTEKNVSEVSGWLEKMILANKLKEEYQNGSGDKKTAYTVVNSVDNQWVDRLITDLEKFKHKDIKKTLAERRTQLQVQYDNSVLAQAVFGSPVLDTVSALEETEKLLLKVVEAQTKTDTETSLLTFLQNYQKAQVGTLKNKAWQAVNGYQQQGEEAIKHLQKTDQSREEVAKSIQEAKNESELEVVYNLAKNDEIYKQDGKSKIVIDRLYQRKKVLFEVDQQTDISPENKTFLKTFMVKIIPDSLKSDDEEQELVWLEEWLKSLQTALESEEKGKIYQKYKNTIDQILTEISEEKQRYQQVKQEENPNQGGNNRPKSDKLPNWAWGFIIVGGMMVGGIIIYLVKRRGFRKISKKR